MEGSSDMPAEFNFDEMLELLEPGKIQPVNVQTDKDIAKPSNSNPEAPSTPRILEPEHPLLKRFQDAFKHHLKLQISLLSDEVFDLEGGVKKCNAQRETRGIDTYEAQQIVSKQQTLLETNLLELEKLKTEREQIELELEDAHKQYKTENGQFGEAHKTELELRSEVEATNALLFQFSKWENDVESELVMNQRISEKTRKDKLKLADEKRAQDMFVHRLQSEVWRLEAELEGMAMQLRVKEEEREKLAEAVVTSNIDIEANESEHRCLIHGWQSVLSAIQLRDKEINSRNNSFNDLNEQTRSAIAEIETIKKLSSKEMVKNETLTMFKMRIETELKNCTNQINIETSKKTNMEKNISKLQTIIEHVEEDIKQITLVNGGKSRQYNILTREFEAVMHTKGDLEQLILHQLQDQITNDKASKYMAKLVGQAKEANAKKEVTFTHLENQNAQVLMEIESQRYLNETALRTKQELDVELDKIDKEVCGYIEVAKHCVAIRGKHLRNIEIFQKRLDEALQKTGGDIISPNELKIKALEMNIEDEVQHCKELQRFWMSEQGHVINLCNQRQAQIKDSNILKKQIMILDQKNLKVMDDIEEYKVKETRINRNIYWLQNKLEMNQKVLDKKRQSKDSLDGENLMKSKDFQMKLEDLELESIRLESCLTELEEEKTTLAAELIEKNREVLEWEKKLKMVLETKKSIKDASLDTGEVGHMKAEIHRMEVRYGHLKKASDQMIHDLEHCVARRDGILTNALAKEKRIQGGGTNRFQFRKRLADVKNKLKQMKTEYENTVIKIESCLVDIKNGDKEVSDLKEEVANFEKDVADIEEVLEKQKTDKLLNFEILVCKQRKLRIYSELSKGRNPYTTFKTSAAQNAEYDKLKDVNDKLLSIVDNLLTDFPAHVHILNRVNNRLKIPMLYI